MADRVWLGRFKHFGIGATALEKAEVLTKLVAFDHVLFADFAALSEARAATDDVIVAWMSALTDGEIAGDMVYKTSKGYERRHPAWVAISHLFNHQTHHRGQVTTLLSQLGKDPGVTDFAVFAHAWPEV